MKAKGDGPAFILQTYADRMKNNKASQELSQKLSERLSNLNLEAQKNEGTHKNTTKINAANAVPPPPPPPPQQKCCGATSSPSTSTTISTLSSPISSTSSTRSNTLKSNPKSAKTDPFTQSVNQAFENNNTLRSAKKGPPVPVKYSVLSYRQDAQNGAQKNINQNGIYQHVQNLRQNQTSRQIPPPSPTPDYDTLSLASTTSTSTINQTGKVQNGDSVEMESLESFRLDQPNDIRPKPPNTYFQKRPLSASVSSQSSQSINSSNSKSGSSLTRNRRPVSVTIGEYPTLRRQPSKLEFLQNSEQHNHRSPEDSLSSRLNSELAQTLNRSNLKKRTESMENLLNTSGQIEKQTNGIVRISLNMSKAFAKSTNDLTCLDQYDAYDTLTNNRVTINVNQSGQSKNNETTPSSILKNGSSGATPVAASKAAQSSHKTICAQKSITFGDMPVVIKDKVSS